MKKRVLYIGADDSNHAGVKKNGEIILATFSFSDRDGAVENFSNRRNPEIVNEWEREAGGDYRFTILTNLDISTGFSNSLVNYEFGSRTSNLPFAVPFLIADFLRTHKGIDQIRLFLDGLIAPQHKEAMSRDFKKLGLELIVEDFPKKRKGEKRQTIKRPYCPRVVYVADYKANYLFEKNFDKISTNKNNVRIPREALICYLNRKKVPLELYNL